MDKLSTVFTTPIGLELFGFEKIVSFLTDNKLFSKARDHVSALFSKFHSGSTKIESKLDTKLNAWLEREAYLVLEHVEVFIPRNLAVPYSEYLPVLLKIADELDASRKILLSQTIATFGYYMNAAGALKAHSIHSGTALGSALDPKAVKWIDGCAKQMSACLSPAVLNDTVPFTKAFKRNGEVAEVISQTHDLYAQVITARAKSIEEESMQLMDLAERLFDMIKNDALYQNPSKVVMNDLIQRLQAAAEWTEFYATYAHQVQSMAVAINDTTAKLTKIAKS